MKLWPKSKAARIILVSLIIFLTIGFTSASILTVAAINYANRPIFNMRDYERKYTERSPLALLASIITMGPTEDKLNAVFGIEMKVTEGIAASAKGDYKAAATHFNDGHQLALRKLGTQSKLTHWVNEMRCEIDVAARDYTSASEHYKELLGEIATCSKTAPDGLGDVDKQEYFYTLCQNAVAAKENGNFKEAITTLDEQALPLAIKMDQDKPNQPDVFYATMLRAMVHHYAREYPSAIASFDQVIRLMQERHASDKDQAYVYMWMGAAKVANQQIAQGLKDLDLAVKLEKDNPDILEQRAYAYFKQNNYAAAIKDTTAALDLTPSKDRKTLYIDRGKYYSYNRQGDLASADFKKAYALAKDKTLFYREVCGPNSPKTERQLGFEMLNLSIKEDPNNPHLYSDRALMYRESKEYKKAINDFKTAIDLSLKAKSDPKTKDPKYSPNLMPIYHSQAWCYNELGKPAEALNVLSEAISRFPFDPSLRLLRVSTCAKLNKKADIKSECQDIFAKNPDKIFPYIFRADVYKMAKDSQNAINDYSTAIAKYKAKYPHLQTELTIEQQRDYYDCYWYRADCYQDLGKKDLAGQDRKIGLEFQTREAKYRDNHQ
ncbi:MAG: tetratricopeptide repeat protein [Candidatus Obscuribacter sp.]|nr:tetratricopeptide repeat protein [Candidatus Obscuribacter sp.]